MARTSKTVIGGGEGEQGERMTRAAASGASAVQQAHGELLGQYRAGQQVAAQTAGQAADMIGAGVDRQEKARQFDVTSRQRESELDLEGEKAGFERGGSTEGGGQEPQTDRQKALQQEMARGGDQPQIGPLETEDQNRLRMQGSKPMEMDRSGQWRPTAEHQAETKTKMFRADTERIRAEAYRDQVGAQAQKAAVTGDEKAFKEHTEMLARPVNAMQGQYDRLMKGDVQTSDWADMKEAAAGSEEVDPTLMADLDAKKWTPRVQQFARATISHEAIKYIVRTGDAGNLKVDWTAPAMKRFTEQLHYQNSLMKAMPQGFGQLAGIKSTADKMRFLNQLAAMQVYLGMDQAPSPQGPSGGMTPATAPMPQQGAPAGGGAIQGGQQPPAPGGETGQQDPRNLSPMDWMRESGKLLK